MVQFVVIFLRFGLCRNNSSSLLVGSHVVYFSPMPVDTKETRVWRHRGIRVAFFWKAALSSLTESRMIYLAISRLSSAPLWQSAPCLCRICSLDTQNNIFHRIISLSLEAGGREKRGRKRDWTIITNGFLLSTVGFISPSNLAGTASIETSAFFFFAPHFPPAAICFHLIARTEQL